MVASRTLFIFITLFLAMVLTISTAPIIDNEVVTTSPVADDETVTKVDEIKETTELPEVVTDHLLFFDVTRIPLGENVETGNSLLFKKDGEKPVIPTTELPRTFQINSFNHTVSEHLLLE